MNELNNVIITTLTYYIIVTLRYSPSQNSLILSLKNIVALSHCIIVALLLPAPSGAVFTIFQLQFEGVELVADEVQLLSLKYRR